MSRRLYLGRLPADTRSDDISKFFDGYGRIVDCRVMTGFGFVEFETAKDAEDAVTNFNGKPFMGAQSILVEFAKESRPRRERFDDDRGGHGTRMRRPPGIRILVSGISRDTSWQDLKDFGRDAGSVSFADIDRDVPGQGILEYLNREDADRAVKDLDGRDLRGRTVRVNLDDARGPDNYRREERRDDRDRYREERYDRGSRRDRSRSPRRSDHEDRRPRSPPPRRDHDDRRYDDRRYDDRRPPPGEREERRRDDREYEERPPRQAANGDGGWSR